MIARIISVGFVGVGLGLLLAGPAAVSAGRKPATHAVAIDGTRFQPEALALAAGDSIVWVNKDPFPHTVTSKDGDFDSHEIQPGASWTYTPRTRGAFAYICSLHPTMKGTLRVR